MNPRETLAVHFDEDKLETAISHLNAGKLLEAREACAQLPHAVATLIEEQIPICERILACLRERDPKKAWKEAKELGLPQIRQSYLQRVRAAIGDTVDTATALLVEEKPKRARRVIAHVPKPMRREWEQRKHAPPHCETPPVPNPDMGLTTQMNHATVPPIPASAPMLSAPSDERVAKMLAAIDQKVQSVTFSHCGIPKQPAALLKILIAEHLRQPGPVPRKAIVNVSGWESKKVDALLRRLRDYVLPHTGWSLAWDRNEDTILLLAPSSTQTEG